MSGNKYNTRGVLTPGEKYGLDSKALVMLLFVMENNVQGRTKMIEDGIMDKMGRQFKRNGTDAEEVAFKHRQTKILENRVYL